MSKRRRAKSSTVRSRPGPARAGNALFGLICVCALALGAFLGSSASAVAAEACPNEQLRAENNSLKLPDCRAYEQVSPVNKEGVRATGGGITLDGNHATFISDGAFAGAPRGGANPYLSSRSAAGWQTTWLQPGLPPFLPSSGLGYTVVGVNSDATSMVLLGDPMEPTWPTQNSSLYLRDAAGHLSWISPMEPGIPLVAAPSLTNPETTPDLSHVVFQAAQRYLDGPAAGLDANAYGLYEWTDGALRLVNVDSSGALITKYGASLAGTGALSRDGERIYFSTPNDIFTPGGPDGVKRIYLRQSGQTTTEISATQCTETSCEGPEQNATYQGASADGAVAFFTSPAQLTNTATAGGGLYRYDVASGKLTLLTPDATDPGGAEVIAEIDNSDDGSIVYFVAKGVLAAGGTAGASNLYVYDANSSSTTFVTTLPADAPGGRRPAETTPSGRYLVFQTAAPITPGYDNAGHFEMYRYDLATKAPPACLTCLPAGEPASGDSTVNVGARVASQNITDDGSRVFFQSSVPLVPGDSNGKVDVYQWHDGTISLISAGTGSSDSWYSSSTRSGSNILFNTYDRLVPEDQDVQMDVYDARVDGGFPAPPAPPATCVATGCRTGAGGAPAPSSVGSTTVSGKSSPARTGKQNRCRKQARNAKTLKQRARRARHQARKAASPKRARQLRQKAKRFESKAARSTKGCTTKSKPANGDARATNHNRRGNR
jgi:hypothetical protein